MAGLADLRNHWRRRLNRFEAELEEGLEPDGCVRPTGLRVGAEVEMAMYEHVRAALERWQASADRAREGQ